MDHDLITDAALRLLGRGGGPALTMRALARELGVEAASLYYHVSGRDQIVQAVVDHVVRQALDDLAAGSADRGLAAMGDCLRAAFAAHQGAAGLAAVQPPSRPVLERLATWITHATGADPRHDQDAEFAAMTLYTFVAGHSQAEFGIPPAGRTAAPDYYDRWYRSGRDAIVSGYRAPQPDHPDHEDRPGNEQGT